MSADLGFPLTWEYVSGTPASRLLATLKEWLQRENPLCLQHPHGFYVVPLRRSLSEEWRFHYWPKGPRAVTGMPAFIHTHNCHVESRVLKGELTNVLYEVSLTAIGGSPLYEVYYSGDRYSPSTSNSLRLTALRALVTAEHHVTVKFGDAYEVEMNAYHEAIVPEEVDACTIVRMHGRSRDSVMVVGLDGYGESIKFRRVAFRASTFLELI